MSFQQFLLILRGRFWLVLLVFSTIVGATVVVSLLMTEKFKAETDVVVNTTMPDPITGAQMLAMTLPNYVATQTDIISSHNVALRVVNKLGLRTNASAIKLWQASTDGKGDIGDWLADVLLKDLSVVPGRDSNVISIIFKSGDPIFAASVANMFAQEYIETSVDLMIQPARKSSQFFDTQLKGLRIQMEQAQARLSDYKRKHGITSSDGTLDVEQARLQGLTSQLIGAQGQTFDLQSRMAQAGRTAEINDDSPEVLSNPLIQQLKTLIAEDAAKLTNLSNTVGVNHPMYQSAQEELNDLKQRLAVETNRIVNSIRSTVAAARQRETSAQKALDSQRNKILSMKKQESDLAVLQRDVENAQRSYDFAMQRAAQTDLQGQLSQTNLAVLNPAVPPINPSSPNLVLNIVVAVFVGGLLAIAAALIAEVLGRIVRVPADIESVVDIPVFGVLKRSKAPRRVWRQKALPSLKPTLQTGAAQQ